MNSADVKALETMLEAVQVTDIRRSMTRAPTVDFQPIGDVTFDVVKDAAEDGKCLNRLMRTNHCSNNNQGSQELPILSVKSILIQVETQNKGALSTLTAITHKATPRW